MPHYKVTQNIFEPANEFHSLKDEVSFSFLVIMLMKYDLK